MGNTKSQVEEFNYPKKNQNFQISNMRRDELLNIKMKKQKKQKQKKTKI